MMVRWTGGGRGGGGGGGGGGVYIQITCQPSSLSASLLGKTHYVREISALLEVYCACVCS